MRQLKGAADWKQTTSSRSAAGKQTNTEIASHKSTGPRSQTPRPAETVSWSVGRGESPVAQQPWHSSSHLRPWTLATRRSGKWDLSQRGYSEAQGCGWRLRGGEHQCKSRTTNIINKNTWHCWSSTKTWCHTKDSLTGGQHTHTGEKTGSGGPPIH